MEIAVQSLNKNWIKIYGRLESIDSTRLTTFLIKFLSKFTNVDDIVNKIKENKIILQTTSIYFKIDNELFLPFNVATFNFFKKIYGLGDVNIKKIKKIKFFPIFSDRFKEYIEKGTIRADFEISDFLEKNVLDRITMYSKVYSVEYSLIRPFLFSIFTNEEIGKILKEKISDIKIFSLGKKKSIGFGLCKFEINENSSLLNILGNRLVYDKIEEEGYYYLLNRVLINSDFLKIVDLDKSYYEIVKITGYLESSKKILYSRRIWLFKEGSIFYLRKSELKTYYIEKIEEDLKYFLPTRPIFVKLNIK